MIGLKLSRLVHASLAGGSLVVGGCADRSYDFGDSGGDGDGSTGATEGSGNPTGNPSGDPTSPTVDPTGDPPPPPDVPGPPQLIAVEMLDNLTLALTFSEGLASTQAVDPKQFRLSAAYAPKGEYYYQYNTYYQEAGNWNGPCEEYCYEYCYYDKCGEQCWDYCQPGPPLRVAAISQLAERPEVLLLTFDNGIGHGVCTQINNFPEQWHRGLFIHYTPTGSAPVTDTVGERLGNIAEHWALQPDRDFAYNQGDFPFMQPVLPIPCPF